MTWIDVVLLGILEGLTEFLPVSSTGHLILLGERLGHHDDAAKTLEIVIQLGAVIAVILHYRARLGSLVSGILKRDAEAIRLALAVAIAFVPSAAVGLVLHKAIKRALFHDGPVAWALIVGGVAMIAADRWVRKRDVSPSASTTEATQPLRAVSLRQAATIGFAQCLSLWPGASRSMTSILGGQLAGLTTAEAAEFSFLLAIPTLGAATLYDLAKNGRALLASPSGPSLLVVGLLAAFAVAWLVIAAFLRYLRRYGLAPFGLYRIALGAIVLLVATRDVPSTQPAASLQAPPSPSASATTTH